MPTDLFRDSLIPATRARGRRATVGVSLALHAAGLAALVGLQFAFGVDTPRIVQPLVAFVAEPELPSLPAAKPVTGVQPDAGPVFKPFPSQPPDGIVAERVDLTPAPPGALAGVRVGGDLTVVGVGLATTELAGPPPSPERNPPTPLRVGGQIAAPTRLSYRAPTYPTVAQAARVEGTVILEATIDERGDVRDVRVLRSIALLDRAAIDAVSAWRYTPTRLNGVPVAVVMTVTVSFTLGR